MYTEINFKTKKKLKEAVKQGQKIKVFQPGPFDGKKHGKISLEGPHYPEAHKWYAEAEINNGFIIPGTVK
jgi:hypothetical protein